MKAQTRRGAAIETGVNLVVGFALTWIANSWIFPFWGFHPPASALLTIGAVMTIVSIARQYTLRRIFEWLRIRKAPPAFLYIAEELANERKRQINAIGYSLAHDDAHTQGELARGACAYAFIASKYETRMGRDGGMAAARALWPFDEESFRPIDARTDLVKAGAMLIAEIGRRDRAAGRSA